MNQCAHAVAIDAIAIEIGGTAIRLESDDPGFHAMVKAKYPGFLAAESHNSRPLRFDVEVLGEGELTEDEDVHVWREFDRWYARRGDFRAEFNLQSGTGCIRQELNPFALNSILRIVHTIYLASQGGFLLHAASAIRNGSAFVFSGVSGAGKTTISRCAPADAVLLSDEISYLRKNGDQYCAWGTPFAGELGQPGSNLTAPVAKFFFLEKGRENHIEDVSRAEATRMLLRNILFFCDDERLVRQVFDSAYDFLESVPVYRLTFVPDATVWNFVRDFDIACQTNT